MKKILEQSFIVKISFLIYAGWWLIVFYYAYLADYSDNNYAGAIVYGTIGGISFAILIIYEFCYLISALVTKNRKQRNFYLLTALCLFVLPIATMILIDFSKALLR